MKILGLIPARGGSKGIPRKNVKLLAGKPLIAWTIDAALRARHLAAVVVSTEDEEIAAVARQFGAQTPFMRPPHLARDESPGLDPVLHALQTLPGFDAVVLLQPTSPLRQAQDIDACIERAWQTGAPSVVSVCQASSHPYWMYRLDAEQRLLPLLEAPKTVRRQDLPPVYELNGAVYFAHSAWLAEQAAFIGAQTVAFVMPSERSVDIDTPLDWAFAESLLKAHP